MPVQVLMPHKQDEAPIDKLIKGLNIVNAYFGIKTDLASAEKHKQDLEIAKAQEEREKQLFAHNLSKAERDSAAQAKLTDAASEESAIARDMAGQLGLKVNPNMSAAQIERSYGPLSEFVKTKFKGEDERKSALAKAIEERKTVLAKQKALADRGYTVQTNPLTGEDIVVPKGKQLPSDKVLLVNEGNEIPSMLEDIKVTIDQNKDAFGPIVGRMGALNPYNTQAQTIDSQVRAASQKFGRFMEGGVLRKEDEEKYRKMFPTNSDTPEVAANKLVIVERMLAKKQQADLAALKNSGYDVKGLERSFAVPDVPKDIRKGNNPQGKSDEAIADPANTRVINGKVYRKVEGGWKAL